MIIVATVLAFDHQKSLYPVHCTLCIKLQHFGKKAHKISPYVVIFYVCRKTTFFSSSFKHTHFENMFPRNIHNDITLIDFQGDFNFYVGYNFNLGLSISIKKSKYIFISNLCCFAEFLIKVTENV